MRFNGILAAILAFALSGCEVTESDSPLVGVWATSCTQMTDSDDELIERWIKGLYEFSAEGWIFPNKEFYSDSNCISLEDTLASSSSPITYYDLGEQALDSGLTGRGLVITGYDQDDTQLGSAEGYYIITDDTLCLSDNFSFGAQSLGVNLSGTPSGIDYENCLTRVEGELN